jgi:hypothetical protein
MIDRDSVIVIETTKKKLIAAFVERHKDEYHLTDSDIDKLDCHFLGDTDVVIFHWKHSDR